MIDSRFLNPLWSTLNGRLSAFARGDDLAKRFDPTVVPFAAVSAANEACAQALDKITTSGDVIYLVGLQPPLAAHWTELYAANVIQMMFYGAPRAAKTQFQTTRLTQADVPDMMRLTGIAYSGFFRERTHELGEFIGLRIDGELVSMLGTRMQFDPFCEITTICTHPDHVGKGYSSQLLCEMISHILSQGRQPFLHVDENNTHARQIYAHSGFREFNVVPMRELQRV